MINHTISALFKLISQENIRQKNTLNLIASENYVSEHILQATGSVLTNKYAEGYPHKRYYAGCTFVDEIEETAINKAKELFKSEHANVQPHSGSSANAAAYQALIKPGDLIMGMSLSSGGHLTHGHGVNFSGTTYKTIQYCVNRDTELLDYAEIKKLAYEHKPKLIICGASAYSRTIDFAQFAAIAKEINAFLIADIAHIAGLIAAGVHPSPVGHADIITSTTHKTLRGPRGAFALSKQQYADQLDKAVFPGMQGGPFMHTIAAKAIAFIEALQPEFSAYQKQVIANAQTMAKAFIELGYRIVAQGTDNHLFIIDLRNTEMSGNEAEKLLDRMGITVTKSCIPFDIAKPWNPSGIRLGTPAITTRGCTQAEAHAIAQMIDDIFKSKHNETRLSQIQKQIIQLCNKWL